jgi:hypothetical protein
MVWRAYGKIDFRAPFDDWDPEMLEPWGVDRVTPKKVFIRSYLDADNPAWKSFALSRARLQRDGWAFSRQIANGPSAADRGALFLVRRPDAYRRKTIGYLMQAEAREILGVSLDASASDVKAAYYAAVKKHHPDLGGEPEAFARVQEAYESLQNAPSLGAILEFIRSVQKESDES